MMGARRHYAIPRMLHQAGLLEHFYTDIVATQGLPRLLRYIPKHWQPKAIQRLAGRIPGDIPLEKVTSYPGFGLRNAHRLSRTSSLSEALDVFTWAAKELARLIKADGFRKGDAIYTFDRCGLELMHAAKAQGLTTIMEQTVAPFRIDQQLLREERARFPDWEQPETVSAVEEARFSAREQAEWNMADIILCGSEYVKAGIVECGGPGDRCKVVPYGVDSRLAGIQREPHGGPLRVLTVGSVGLRKGAPYILEAAKRLKGTAVFRMVGSIQVSTTATAQLREHLELTGQAPRSEVSQHYQWADVFLLPSLNEGSAGVVYEALSCGLPVICTPNTGSVVRDGENGFIVPIRDVATICEKLSALANDHACLHALSVNAKASSQDYSLESYRTRLLASLGEFTAIRLPSGAHSPTTSQA